MFVHLLSATEQAALVRLLASIVQADDEVTPSQEQYLTAYAAELGTQLALDQPFSIEHACAGLHSYTARVVALQEVVKIALSQGQYGEQEKEGALVIADRLKIPFERFEQIESWVAEGIDWACRGEELLQPA